MLVLGWLFMVTVALAVKRDERSTVPGLLLCSMVAHFIGFYWLPETTTFFGGFPYWVSLLILLFYCAVASLQFVLCGILYDSLRGTVLSGWDLVLGFSWCTAEFIMPKIFPWLLAHTQTVWSSFAAWAEFGGTVLLSLPLMWWASLAASAWIQRSFNLRTLIGVLVLAAMTLYGWQRNAEVLEQMSKIPPYRFALIQGNLAAKQKGDPRQLEANLDLYRKLSEEAEASGADIIIWPESVAAYWTPGELQNLRDTRFDPAPEISVPFIYGGLSYERRPEEEQQELIAEVKEEVTDEYRKQIQLRFNNSAFAIGMHGETIGRYDKRALMPMGEFLPFERSYPSVRKLSPHTGNFDRGQIEEPFLIQLKDGGRMKVMPLICYEDLVPRLSLEAVEHGAQVLLNLTNDVWYGDTVAPYQHHLLALWRAIETRRYLLRSTNTGFTGVVDPLGRTTASLPIFTEGILQAEVHPLDISTWYVEFGDKLVQILALLIVTAALICRVKRRKLT